MLPHSGEQFRGGSLEDLVPRAEPIIAAVVVDSSAQGPTTFAVAPGGTVTSRSIRSPSRFRALRADPKCVSSVLSAWRVVGPQRVRIVCDDSPDCQKTFPPVPRSTSRRRNRGRRGCVIPYRCPRCRSLPASPRLSLRPVRSGTTRKHACEPPTEMESSVEEIAASTLDASALFHPDDESPHTLVPALEQGPVTVV